MKIRKTRIKKTTKANGSMKYIAEYKWGFWWYQFDDCMGGCANARNYYYDWAQRHCKYQFSEQEAKSLIDYYIKRVNYWNSCNIENKVVKVEYEGYP